MNAEPLTDVAPNWAEITIEPHCPLCEYMLRGLSLPRCPECGYRFDWSEVLSVANRDHPYLFEHHPDRNVWSYFKTVVGAMRPRRFWSLLHPAQYGSTRRLLIFHVVGLIALATIVLSTPATFIMIAVAIEPYTPAYRHYYAHQPPYWTQVGNHLSDVYFDWRAQRTFLTGSFIIGLWPWSTLLALQIFQVSMRKAKVKAVHVIRCVVYSLDHWLTTLVWIAVLSTVFVIGMIDQFSPTYYPLPDPDEVALACAAGLILLYTYRLGVAYRRYLRFDHAMAVAISAQLITLLSMAIVLVFILNL